MAMPPPVDENIRIQKILDEISAKPSIRGTAQSGMQQKAFEMEPSAKDLLMSYVNELACCVLEEASALATHRKSTEIDAIDINFILAKKFGIEVPGGPRVKTLHKHQIKGLLDESTARMEYSRTAPVAPPREVQHVQQPHTYAGASLSGNKRKTQDDSETESDSDCEP